MNLKLLTKKQTGLFVASLLIAQSLWASHLVVVALRKPTAQMVTQAIGIGEHQFDCQLRVAQVSSLNCYDNGQRLNESDSILVYRLLNSLRVPVKRQDHRTHMVRAGLACDANDHCTLSYST